MAPPRILWLPALLLSILLSTPAVFANGCYIPQQAYPAMPTIPVQRAIIGHRDGHRDQHPRHLPAQPGGGRSDERPPAWSGRSTGNLGLSSDTPDRRDIVMYDANCEEQYIAPLATTQPAP